MSGNDDGVKMVRYAAAQIENLCPLNLNCKNEPGQTLKGGKKIITAGKKGQVSGFVPANATQNMVK